MDKEDYILYMDPVRISALDTIQIYLDDIEFAEMQRYHKFGLSLEEIERYSNMKWTLKELRKLVSLIDEPPLIIIERFGRKMKAYSVKHPTFEDSLPVCDTLIDLLS